MELPGASRRDVAALANVVNTLVNLGLRVPEAWAHAQFDIPEPGLTAERLLTPSQNNSTGTPENPLNGSIHRGKLILANRDVLPEVKR
jgi:phage gp29-like protein